METAEQVGSPETEKAARWEDYVDVFFSPAQLFDRRRSEGWLKPAGILGALTLILYYAMLPANQAIIESALAQRSGGQAVPESATSVMLYLGGVFGVIALAFQLGATALWTWVVVRIVETKMPLRSVLMIVAYAAFTLLLYQVVIGGLVLLQRGETIDMVRDLSLGPLRFMDTDTLPKPLVPLLRRLEPFILWYTALIGVGIYVVGRTSKAVAALAALIVWLTSAVPGVLMAILNPNA